MKLIRASVPEYSMVTMARSFFSMRPPDTFAGRTSFSDCVIEFSDLEVLALFHQPLNGRVTKPTIVFGPYVYQGLTLIRRLDNNHYVCAVDNVETAYIGT